MAMAQVRTELTQEKERAVAEERQRWQTKMADELHQLKMRTDAEKQVSLCNLMLCLFYFAFLVTCRIITFMSIIAHDKEH